MNIFRKKKFIPIKTYEKKAKNKNHYKNNSIKRTNSQILYEHINNNEIIDNMDINNSIQTKSLKNSTSEDPLYLEQKNYDIESSKNFKNISRSKDNTSSIKGNISSNNFYNNNDELLNYKNSSDNSVKKLNLNKIPSISKTNKHYIYLNKSSSNQSVNKNNNVSISKNSEQSSQSNISESNSNFNDLNIFKHEALNKKGLIYNYNQMNNYIKNNNKQRNKKNAKEYKSQSYSKYFDLIKKAKINKSNMNNIDDNETSSTNEFTKLKSKYLELKNVHDLTLSKLKKEKKKNQKQKEEIEFIINNIKSGEKKENNIEEMNEAIKKLKEENDMFRQELVLSQALINSLQSELKNKNINNSNHDNTIEEITENGKNDNFKLNQFNKKKSNDINNLIKEINELNYSLNKKNEIIDSVLIENKKLRKQLKYNNNIYPDNNNNFNNNIYDLLYDDAMDLINKYSQYRNSNMDDYSNLILTEQFFNELEKLKKEIENIKKQNNTEIMIEYYISLIRLISNEFDKLLLYNNNFWKEKYLKKFKNTDDNNNINKNIELHFNKQKHDLMDLCLLSSAFLNGLPKDLILDGINLIKNLENLYKEKNRIKDSGQTEKDNINDLIMRQEKQLDNIKKKLSYNQFNQSNYNHYLSNSNSTNNIKNILGLTYMTNYYNNINNNDNY